MPSRTTSLIVVTAFVAALAGFAASRWLASRSAPPPATTPAAASTAFVAGTPAPRVALADLSGAQRDLADWRGKTILVNFWATWCAPCVEEMPLLDGYAKAHPGLVVLGIALDEPGPVRGFVERTGVGYPILLDTPGAADSSVRLGNARGVLPYSVLIDAQGKLAAQKIGAFDDLAELEAFVAPALEQTP